MSLVSITLCILVMIDPDVSHFYLTCLGREEHFRYKFCIELCFSFLLLKSNATFALHKHVSLFSHFDILFFSHNPSDFYAKLGPRGKELKGPIWQPVR